MAKKTNSADALLERAYALNDEKEARELYRDWAESYDETMLGGLGYLTPQKCATLLREHVADRRSVILDVGSGTGLAGKYLAGLGYETLDALDLSAEMLAVAGNRRFEGRPVYRRAMEADLNKPLALADASYDAMICTGTFTHAHVGAACLDELFRVLRPAGRFACTVHGDVWEPAGFSDAVERLEASGTIRTLHKQMDVYFETDEAPQGWYIVWEKCT